jgi:cobalt-zinc-cadmium efflux system outer membrane protein
MPAAGLFLALLCLETSCIKYQPHELNPVLTEQQFRARSLDSPGLAEFVRKENALIAWPPTRLDPETLTYIAYYFSPSLEVARAKAGAANAAVQTARQRPNPSLNANGGYNPTPDSVATYGLSLSLTIETAGKRGYRILEARKLAEASRIAVYEAAWQVRSAIRGALVSWWSASRTLELLRAENTLRTEVVAIYSKRVELGEAAVPELSVARSEQLALAVNVLNAEGEVSKALSAIAQASGLPLSLLQHAPLDLAAFSKIPAPDSLPVLQMQRAGLVHRADIRRTLLEYEAADADLRLALANQYPNIPLNPAYGLQEGFPQYTLGAILESLPVFHRNQGPIAEREATRRVLEAQFKALQAQVAGKTESAVLEYRAAAGEWLEEHDALLRVHQQREAMVMSAFRAGDRDSLDVAQARLLTIAAQKEELDALLRAHNALSALEDAVQAPLGSGVPAPRPEMTN